MKNVRAHHALVLALLAVGLVSCGGGGGGGGGSDSGVNPPPGGGTTSLQGEYVVVQFDQDADGYPDLLTLDKANTPFTVVEALRGTADGGTVDATATLAGVEIDPAVSETLAAFLAESFDVASERELTATDSQGSSVTLTVYE